MAAVIVCSDFGAQENKICHCFHFFPFYLLWSDGLDATVLVFWMLSFKPAFSLSSFTFIKKLFSSSFLSAIRVVSSAYPGLCIFLLAVLISACASSSPAFCTPQHLWGSGIVKVAPHSQVLHRFPPVVCKQSSSLLYPFFLDIFNNQLWHLQSLGRKNIF